MAIFLDQQKPSLKNEIPIVPLRDTVVFPSSMIPITVGRPKVKLGLDGAWASDRLAVFVSQKNPRTENPAPNDIYSVARTITEFWRIDTWIVDGVKIAHIFSLAAFVCGIGFFVSRSKNRA